MIRPSDRSLVGVIVQYRDIVDPGDAQARFIVVEDNGDRLLGSLICDMHIKPLTLLRRADLVESRLVDPESFAGERVDH